MIELLRYARLKPDGLTSVEVNTGPGYNGELGVAVKFKRFSVENGREETPEESFVTFDELEKRQAELQIELGAVKDLLALKSR